MVKKTHAALSILALLSIVAGTIVVYAEWTPVPVEDDPLVRMPGTQPGTATLEGPGRCLNCHADYNHSVEPGFNWMGSMMSQASRDFLFWACMTVAAQDSIWAVGTPNATDICERCHFPTGWVEGRSDPTNASLMTGDDFDGVSCDFCHNLYDPFFHETFTGAREGNDWLNYWDETNASDTPSDAFALETYQEDGAIAQGVHLFSGQPFFDESNQPVYPTYTVNGAGQYFVSPNGQKRSSYADAEARHQMLYSRYHKSKYLCATCHDVSNPVLANAGLSGLVDQDGEGPDLITEQYPPWQYFHVERTFSEFMLSGYAQQGGAAGIGPFAPESFDTSSPDNYIAKCQDCHMRDVVGAGANKRGIPVRPDESVEHPNSGLPLHDLTGGNAWVSYVLASAMPGSANFDQINYDLLNQGPAVLTLDMTAGQSADPAAILAGVERSQQQLLLAASINNLSYNPGGGALSFQVQNQTGHKLISGFPEGRRMFVNVKASYPDGSTYEVNPYDYTVGTLRGLPHSLSSPPLGPNEIYIDELVYEAHPSSSLTSEDHTFHFALATDRYKDNRIPPKGFRLDDADDRLSQPRSGGEDAPGMYTSAENAGGYDQVDLAIPPGAHYVEVNLYYQTTSREYVEFLRDEINGDQNLTLPGPPEAAYVIQTDPFFAQLKAWGNTIWDLWLHNKDIPGAAPFLMTQAIYGQMPPPCAAPIPTLYSAEPASNQVTPRWENVHSGNASVLGYKLYYDQAGKSQLIVDIPVGEAALDDQGHVFYTDTGLNNGLQYCYKVTSYDAECESDYSDIKCATPEAPGQTLYAGVNNMETGYWSGKGKTKTFVLTQVFNRGDEVIFRAYVVDQDNAPVEGAIVDIDISGPATVSLTTGPSDSGGVAEASWKTSNRGGDKTPLGDYSATVTNVTATGYNWDGVMSTITFTIQ